MKITCKIRKRGKGYNYTLRCDNFTNVGYGPFSSIERAKLRALFTAQGHLGDTDLTFRDIEWELPE